MSKARMEPKRFPFTGEVTPELQEAVKFLKKWKQDIDDRLFREGYEMRDGQLFELNNDTPISAETYWKQRREKGLPK